MRFDNQNYFEAIFSGVNRYRFKQALPIIGHSYLSQIIMNSLKRSIIYIPGDQNIKQIERFDQLLDSGFISEAQRHFTGIEWWVNNFPYPIRYHVEISGLMFGLSDDPLNPESLIYRPCASIK